MCGAESVFRGTQARESPWTGAGVWGARSRLRSHTLSVEVAAAGGAGVTASRACSGARETEQPNN